jgi:hypothetical protein
VVSKEYMQSLSGLSWLVFSDSDIQEARRLIDELDTTDSTVDTLGFALVLESVSEIFFPATTTLHRKIRYQIFVPALVWALVRQKDVADPRAALRKLEFELQRALVDAGETEGVIGRNRKEALKYWPSLLYWNSTNLLRLFGNEPLSMQDVFAILQERRDALINDDNEIEAHAVPNEAKSISFDSRFQAIAEALFVKKHATLQRPVGFSLTRPEADYLKRKVQELFPVSLSSYLLDRTSRAIERLDSPFELTATRSEKLNELVRQAELFSEFAMGATYAYRWALCEHLRVNAKDPASRDRLAACRDRAEAHFARWRKESPNIKTWSYKKLTIAAAALDIALDNERLEALQGKISDAARLKGPVRQALEHLKKPIRDHERDIKANASRFENSNIAIPKNVFEKEYRGNTLFDYRWRIGHDNALTIVRALEGAK